MVRLLTFAHRSAVVQLAGGALLTAIEAGIFGLALLMMIVSAGEVARYPGAAEAIVENFLFLWGMFAVTLPFALMVSLIVLWPTAAISGGLLLLGAAQDRRFAATSLWIATGAAVGIGYGWLFFVEGLPRFDIVEGPLAPVAALAWAGASGGFAGRRLRRKLGRAGRFGAPVAVG
ncbi:hypothetical protein EEB18_009215 [Sphingopyxis sp. OPL5]|uniref:hypothetical protein n=1 Tax=Sphingopyxis sp. OPL5 TaxID=2486273 RepID=UPI00165718FD|nr:hypothetical protein [Sphingopyxis sp. OPL5]QNO29088.1 hypothetical protein EEB18_009215 [Sphingopyxis sp. OPL5]